MIYHFAPPSPIYLHKYKTQVYTEDILVKLNCLYLFIYCSLYDFLKNSLINEKTL